MVTKPWTLCVWLMMNIVLIQGSTEGLYKGYGNILHDSIDADVDIKYGVIPEWINGILVHHTCGTYGEFGSNITESKSRINHVFDCISLGQSFKFEDGRVSFYNRFYDTVQMDIFKSYNMNMSESKVFWRTGFADFDNEQVLKHEEDFEKASKTKPKNVPHVTWWKVKDKAMAMTEETSGVQIDVHDMTVIQDYPFKDDNFGYDDSHFFINNPAHESTDPDGTIWSNVMVFVPNWWTFSAKQWRLVYKVVDDVRIPVAEIPYPDLSTWNCAGDDVYSDPDARMAYLHSFAITEHYVILPENSYVFEPCAILGTYASLIATATFGYSGDPESIHELSKNRLDLHGSLSFLGVRACLGCQRVAIKQNVINLFAITQYMKAKDVPYYKVAFKFEKDIPSIIRVIRKSDGKIMASIKTDPFFTTHQLNAYEENGVIHADMLTFDDASLYTEHTWVDAAIGGPGFSTYVHRFTINTEDWTMKRRNLMPEPGHFEMSHTRPDLLGYKYKYGYFCEGIYYDKDQIIHKLNVDTGELKSYVFDEDVYPQEPWFLPTPNGSAEDDGVLLVQGFDGKVGKGFLMVIDAKTMTPTAYAEAPDMILFGFHVKFFPLDTKRKADMEIVKDEL